MYRFSEHFYRKFPNTVKNLLGKINVEGTGIDA